MSRHHVREHHWVGGILSTVEHFFDSLEDAKAHADNSGAHTIKIYDESGELQHIVSPQQATNTYA